MQFKTLLLLAFAPIALSAVAPEADTASTKTLTLVPSGYTPPVSTQTPTPTSISTVTPTSTPTPTSTWTPKSSSTPSSASLSKIASTSTPLIKATAVESETAASTSPPANGAATHQLPGAVAAGVVAIAGLLMI